MNDKKEEFNEEPFEGEGNVNIFYTSRNEHDTFEDIKEGLALPDKIDLYLLSASICFYKEQNGTLEKDLQGLPSSTEMAKMYTFKKTDIYDSIITHVEEKHKNRLEEFEKYFYTGFQIVKDWWIDEGIDKENELARIVSLKNYVEEEHD